MKKSRLSSEASVIRATAGRVATVLAGGTLRGSAPRATAVGYREVGRKGRSVPHKPARKGCPIFGHKRDNGRRAGRPASGRRDGRAAQPVVFAYRNSALLCCRDTG